MGQRGPASTPTPILQLCGSKRVTKRRNEVEAKGPSGTRDCPTRWTRMPASKSGLD